MTCKGCFAARKGRSWSFRTASPTAYSPFIGAHGAGDDLVVKHVDNRYAKTVDGFHIAYRTLGEGRLDILLLGAYYGNLEHDAALPSMEHVNRSLAEIGRVVRLDGRGTGLSDRTFGDRLPTLEQRIDDVRAVLDAIESRRTVLVSFADSGPLACLFAATYPRAHSRLGLV
jgi:pimeloyl-ACP methyl ester carboxylesterase